MKSALQKIEADYAVSVADFNASPAGVLDRADGRAVAVLGEDRVMAYLVPPETFEAMLDQLDDIALAEIAKARAGETPRRVGLDEL